ncbi:MAG: hypothetical protein WCY16_03470 [Weeksellaceae bacterium]
MKHIKFLLIISTFISCNTSLDIDVRELESFMGVKLRDYTVIRHESSIGIGNMTKVLEVGLTEESMKQLLKDIDLKKYSVADNNIYYLNIFSDSGGTRQSIIINISKRTITYSYRD